MHQQSKAKKTSIASPAQQQQRKKNYYSHTIYIKNQIKAKYMRVYAHIYIPERKENSLIALLIASEIRKWQRARISQILKQRRHTNKMLGFISDRGHIKYTSDS